MVVLAGCAGSQSPNPADGDSTTTATLDDLEFPDGANETGIYNASALFAAHNDALAETGYELQLDVTRRDANGSHTVHEHSVVRSSVASGELARNDSRMENGHRRRTVSYTNDTSRYAKHVDSEVTYEVGDPAANVSTLHRRNDANRVVKQLLALAEYRNATLVQQDGRTLVEYSLTEFADESAVSGNVTNASGWVRVSPDGLVYAASLEYTTAADGREAYVSADLRFTEIGEVEVRTPDWVSDAAANDTDERSRVHPVATTGHVTASDRVDAVRLVVMRPAGADPIDLSAATVQWSGPESAATLTYGENSSEGQFGVTVVRDSNDSVPVLDEHDDRLVVTIPLSKMGSELTAGQEATVRITTESGATTTVRIAVPESLDGEDTVSL